MSFFNNSFLIKDVFSIFQAFLGAQLVITMIMVSFLQKIMPYFSFSRFILCHKLVRYLHPSDESLKQSSGKPVNNGGRRHKKDHSKSDVKNSGFNVPRNVDVQLEVAPVQPEDIIHLHYYPEFHWLIDFSISTLIVYAMTEFYYYWSPFAKAEINLSMLWTLLVVLFSLKILCSLTGMYFTNEATQGERSMTLVSGSSFFLLAMIVLIADEKVLEFGLLDAQSSLSKTAAEVLKSYGINATAHASKLTFKFVLAVWSGLIGAFFTFPGMRGAKMHLDSLNYTEGSYFKRSLLHLNMFSMIIMVLLWVKPISRDCLTTLSCSNTLKVPIMDDESFNSLRVYIIISIAMLRIILMPEYLQSYLNIAHDRMKQLKKEAGRINSLELQRRVARIFYYLCVVALQYIAPVLIVLYLGLMLKTLGGYVWHPNFIEDCEYSSMTSNQTNSTDIFTKSLFRGVLNYATWWCCYIHFSDHWSRIYILFIFFNCLID
ncbi:Transmembrane protein 161B [Nymphon striatum]|nr:Transmembrane protein 161B [Nymphon striatum]